MPTPPSTKTYHAVPYAEVITRIESKIAERLMPWELATSRFSLGSEGQQLFAVFNLEDHGDAAIDAVKPSVVACLSHDYSLSVKVAGGGHCYACANGMLSSDGVKVMRKHTKNFYRDFDALLEDVMADCVRQYHNLQTLRSTMKETPITTSRGYEILGLAFGENMLTPTQLSLAVAEWREPSYGDAFRERDAWSLYNAITSGLKKGHFRNAIKRFSGAHDWFAGNVVDVEVVE